MILSFLKSWNTIRVIRMVLGILFVIQAVKMADNLSGIVGIFLLFQAFTNKVSCCANTCRNVAVDKKYASLEMKVITDNKS